MFCLNEINPVRYKLFCKSETIFFDRNFCRKILYTPPGFTTISHSQSVSLDEYFTLVKAPCARFSQLAFVIIFFFLQNIFVEDRAAFACMYLPDLALNTYISSLAHDLINNGKLEGIAIVGLCTKSGITLLQNYLDRVRLISQL